MNTHNFSAGFVIRKIRPGEISVLEDFLYLAIYQPAGSAPLPREIVKEPRVSIYVDGFGRADDHCFVAETDDGIVGAVWVRILAGAIKGFGYVDDNTPEFAVSLLPEYRNRGIGAALMRRMIAHLKKRGYAQASLSVDKANYAVKMYRKLGFEVVAEHGEDYLMLLRL